jgi:PAS domain S-box-containing protein
MGNPLSYEELHEQYLELQLRVTRFSAIEQELINTRDRLDQELELYKRLNVFNSSAIRCQNLDEFFQLSVESIVDILEVQVGFAYLINKKTSEQSTIYYEGCDAYQAELVKNELLEQAPKSRIINRSKTLVIQPCQNNQCIIDKGLCSQIIPINDELELLIGSLVLKEKSPLYAEITNHYEVLFSVFVQQVLAYVSNILVEQENLEQLKLIAASELELKKLSLIATKTKSGVIITDNHGRIEWVNESFEKTTGYTLGEVIGRKPKDFLQYEPIINKEAREKLADALSKKENVEVTILNVAKSGAPYFNQLEISPIFDDKGNHINFIALQKDITSEENYKNELIKTNSRFELITSHSGIGIWDWNPISNRSVWNDAMYQLFETTPSEDLDNYSLFINSIHPDDRVRTIGDADSVLKGESEFINHEYRIILPKSGEIRYIQSLVVSEKGISGNVVRVVGSVVDITETRVFEDTLIEKNEQLEKINQELDQFVYSVSHDLRSPLMSIKGLISVMELSLQNEDLMKQYLNLIEQSVGRLDDTILEILDYSKNSRIEVQHEEFDIQKLVEEVFQDHEHYSNPKIDFRLTLIGSRNVNSDKLRIATLLKNFIGNAVKYRNKQIDNPFVKVQIENNDNTLTIAIEDNGEGISEDNQKKVFNMFYRASNSSSGTGLGLYICKEIIIKMGGSVHLDSELQKGTTIHLTLPLFSPLNEAISSY